VKKTLFTAYDSSLKAGLIAINLRDGDELVQVVPTDGEDDIFLTSRRGQAIRFSEEDVRAMGRTAAGVVGMKFRGDDHLVSCDVLEPDAEFLVITSEGYGKRTDPEAFGRKGRAGLGMRCIRVNAKKGEVVGAMFVAPTDEILLISHNGVVIRTAVSDISVQGRDASGVTVMNLADGDHVSAVARLLEVDEDDTIEDDAIEDDAVESPGAESEAFADDVVDDDAVESPGAESEVGEDETGDED
jgi:DNA gyrase subunit A